MIVDYSKVNEKYIKLTEKPQVGEMLTNLSNLGPLLVFGGAVRDWALSKPPRDIDLVVDCPVSELSFLKEFKGRKNSFGGYKLALNEIEFDIWTVGTTWALNHDTQFDFNVLSIPRTVFNSSDAIAYRVDTGEILDAGFQYTMDSQILDIVYEPNPFPKYAASKALAALVQYKLYPSDNLKKFIAEQQALGYGQKDFDKYLRLNKISRDSFSFEECLGRLK